MGVDEERKKYQREYYLKNKDRLKKYKKKYYQSNREQIIKKSLAYVEQNRENGGSMTKNIMRKNENFPE